MNTEVATTARALQFLDDVENVMLSHSGMEPFLRPLHKSFYKVSQMAEIGRKARELFEAAKAEDHGKVEYCEEMQNCPEAVDQHQQAVKELEIEIEQLMDDIVEEAYNNNIRTDTYKRVKRDIAALLRFEIKNTEGTIALSKEARLLELFHDGLLGQLVESQGRVVRAQIRLCDLTDKFLLVVAEKELDDLAEEFLNIEAPTGGNGGTPNLEIVYGNPSDLANVKFEDHPMIVE